MFNSESTRSLNCSWQRSRSSELVCDIVHMSCRRVRRKKKCHHAPVIGAKISTLAARSSPSVVLLAVLLAVTLAITTAIVIAYLVLHLH